MDFEEEFPIEMMYLCPLWRDERYDALLSEYTKLKEEVQSFGSEKDLDDELGKYISSLKSITETQQNSQTQSSS